jgi:hypothetical protein
MGGGVRGAEIGADLGRILTRRCHDFAAPCGYLLRNKELRMIRLLAAAAALAALAGCASGPPEIAWQPRAGFNLGADKSQCRQTADNLDIASPKQFTDGRYGVAVAMAAKVDEDSDKAGAFERMREAVFEDCMTRKGWAPK